MSDFKVRSPLLDSFRPVWPSQFPQGKISMNDLKYPSPGFKIQIPQYKYTLATTQAMLNVANNVGMPQPPISGKVNRLRKTTPLAFERFTDFDLVDPRIHIRPIWMLIAFMILIMILLSIA